MNEIIYSKEDLEDFRDWLQLNLNSITWEGRYSEQFDMFWKNFFVPSVNLSRIQERFEYTKRLLKTGPLLSWFNWLNKKFLIYTFLKKDVAIKDLAQFSNNELSAIALLLRDYYVEKYPYLDEGLNEIFQLSQISTDKARIKHSDIVDKFATGVDLNDTWDDGIMNSLEVTLYPEWKKLINDLERNFYGKKITIKKLKERSRLKKQVKFFREAAILCTIGAAIFFAMKFGNQWYESRLASKITLFEPNLFWLDKTISFKESKSLTKEEIDLTSTQIDRLEEIESNEDPFANIEDLRFEEESDVTVASIESLPKNFSAANLERSSYEEQRKGGYRNSRFGTGKAYRVMMNSIDPLKIKTELNKYLTQFQAEQVDKVKPGQEIPGGIYYNVYIPLDELKEFLFKVTSLEKSIIYESKTRGRTPFGKAKIFIWIKSI